MERLCPFDLEIIAHHWKPKTKNEKGYKNLFGLSIKKKTGGSWRKITEN